MTLQELDIEVERIIHEQGFNLAISKTSHNCVFVCHLKDKNKYYEIGIAPESIRSGSHLVNYLNKINQFFNNLK
jgi:hypothetical protein